MATHQFFDEQHHPKNAPLISSMNYAEWGPQDTGGHSTAKVTNQIKKHLPNVIYGIQPTTKRTFLSCVITSLSASKFVAKKIEQYCYIYLHRREINRDLVLFKFRDAERTLACNKWWSSFYCADIILQFHVSINIHLYAFFIEHCRKMLWL